jgi:hypothetical protein
LNEICPFLHKPYGRHNQPTNYLLPLCATNILIMIMPWKNYNLCSSIAAPLVTFQLAT